MSEENLTELTNPLMILKVSHWQHSVDNKGPLRCTLHVTCDKSSDVPRLVGALSRIHSKLDGVWTPQDYIKDRTLKMIPKPIR